MGRLGIRASLVLGLILTACGPAGGPKGKLANGQALGQGAIGTDGGVPRGPVDAGWVDAGADCPAPDLEDLRARVFVPRCATSGCHASAAPAAGLALDTEGAELRDSLFAPSTQSPSGMPLVTPREIGASYLFLKVSLPAPLSGDPMPPEGRLPECEIRALRSWIEGGAL